MQHQKKCFWLLLVISLTRRRNLSHALRSESPPLTGDAPPAGLPGPLAGSTGLNCVTVAPSAAPFHARPARCSTGAAPGSWGAAALPGSGSSPADAAAAASGEATRRDSPARSSTVPPRPRPSANGPGGEAASGERWPSPTARAARAGRGPAAPG